MCWVKQYVRRSSSCWWFSLIFLCSCFQKKKQRELKESWARWTACLQGQPITAVRFGLQHNSLFITLLFYSCSYWSILLFSMSSHCQVGSSINKTTCHPPPRTLQALFRLIIENNVQYLMLVQIRVVGFVFRFPCTESKQQNIMRTCIM